MRIFHRAGLAALIVALATPLALQAQEPTAPATLQTGKWTGQVTTPNGETTAVTYDVALKNDTLSITINAAEHGTFAASSIKVEPGKLNFAFTPGPVVQCALLRKDDGSYGGTCTDEMGGVAQMSMLPPKKAPAGS